MALTGYGEGGYGEGGYGGATKVGIPETFDDFVQTFVQVGGTETFGDF